MNIIKQIFDLPDTPSGKKLRKKILNRFPIEKKDKIEVIKKIESGELTNFEDKPEEDNNNNNTDNNTSPAFSEIKGNKFLYLKYIGGQHGLINTLHVVMTRGTGWTSYNAMYAPSNKSHPNSYQFLRDVEIYAGTYTYKDKKYEINTLADLIEYESNFKDDVTKLSTNYAECTKEEFINLFENMNLSGGMAPY